MNNIRFIILVLTLSACLIYPQDKEINSKPWTYWWWMGSAVDEAGITYNLEKFADAGIGGVHIIPIYGVKGYEDKFIDFLSPKWMEMLAYTSVECGRLGIGLDMTLGTGWPFGGPQVTPEYSSSQLIDVTLETANRQVINLNIINEAKQKVKDNPALSVISVNAYYAGKFIDIKKYVNDDGILTWQAPADNCKIIALVLASPVQQVKRAAPGGKGNVVDPFSSEAMLQYLVSFDKAFENYKEKMPRSFYHDSYEYYGADWTNNFLGEFEKRRGYNLQTVLPELLSGDSSDVISRIRSDYRQTIAELHEEFIKTAAEWSHKKGSLFRDQAHGSPSNLLDTYAASDIPEAEVFGSPKLDIPGLPADTSFMRKEFVDPLLLKFPSSAAHVTGKNLISSETGTWLSEHFRETLSQIKPEIDLLFISGINFIFFHGITYSPANEEWPGWLFYAATNFGPTNSFWYDIPSLNNYIARCQSVLREGTPDNDLLIYFPVWDTWFSSEKGSIKFEMHNPEAWLFGTKFYETAKTLFASGYSFDYISDKQILGLQADKNNLISGLGSYKTIVIPSCRFMPVETLNKLYEIIKAGGSVIFMDQVPGDVPGYYKHVELKEQLQNISRRVKEIKNTRQLIVPADSAGLVSALIKTGIHGESLSQHKLNYIRRKTAECTNYFIVNQQSATVNEWIELACTAVSVIILDPLNGNTGLAKIKTSDNGTTSVYLQIEPGASLIIKALDTSVKMEPWKYLQKSGNKIEITGQWKVEFIQGGPVIPEAATINKLASWTTFSDVESKRFAGTARYTVKFKNPDKNIKEWILDLGKVCESARVKINGKDIGTLWAFPFSLSFSDIMNEGENVLEVEVTNMPANRIIDLDKRGVNWKKFQDINFVNINYKKFDASAWELVDSGLLGPVVLCPAKVLE